MFEVIPIKERTKEVLTWYTEQDEQELLIFDQRVEAERSLQKAFRALYIPTPGFASPTPGYANGVPLEIECHFFPKRYHNKESCHTISLHRKFPMGVCNKLLYDVIHNRDKMERVSQQLMMAISNRQQQYMLKYAKEQGWSCAACSKPCTIVNAKVFNNSWKKVIMNPCTPQCGGEKCRLILQKDAEIAMNDFIKNNIPVDPDVHPECKKDVAKNEQTRTCRVCDKPDTSTFKVMACTRCKITFYCSKDCQTKDWKRHKKACKAVAALEK